MTTHDAPPIRDYPATGSPEGAAHSGNFFPPDPLSENLQAPLSLDYLDDSRNSPHCPDCGAVYAFGSLFCPRCGRRLGVAGPPPTPKKRTPKNKALSIGLAAGAAVFCVAVAVFLAIWFGKKEPDSPQTDEALSSQQDSVVTPQSTVSPTQDDASNDDDAMLLGEWRCCRRDTDNPDEVCVYVLSLLPTAEASAGIYYYRSDYFAIHDGRWSFVRLSDGSYRITLQLDDGTAWDDDNGELRNTSDCALTVRVSEGRMDILSTQGQIDFFSDLQFIKDLDPDEWVAQNPSPSRPTLNDLSVQEISDIYKAYYGAHFPGDAVSLVNVAESPCLLDMIILHFDEEEPYTIHGYVFSLNENCEVYEVYHRTGSDIHALGYFSWYISDEFDAPTDLVFASVDGSWGMGLGELTFHIYYLSADGREVDIYSVSVRSSDYRTQEEIDAAYNQYEAAVAEQIPKFYSLYVGAAVEGIDPNSLGSFFEGIDYAFFE